MKHRYQKLGGWLLTLQVLLILFLLIFALATAANVWRFKEERDMTPFVSALATVVVCLMGMFPFWQLLRRKPKFLQNYHIIMFLVIVLNYLHSIVLRWNEFALLFGQARGNSGSTFGAVMLIVLSLLLTLLPNAALFFLPRLYFIRSVRVRTYMGTDRYLTECIFTRRLKKLPEPAVPDAPEGA